MVILSVHQMREWDAYTIREKPIAAIDLMEYAATKCFEWLQRQQHGAGRYSIFCGKGNNGGDGLAIARMLANAGCSVSVHILELGKIGSEEFQTNLARLHLTEASIHYIQTPEHFPPLQSEDLIIDALFGTGLNRKLEGLAAQLVDFINSMPNTRIAIDVPSGLLADDASLGNGVIIAHHTLSFQCMKQAFLMAENEGLIGNLQLLDIGLLPQYLLGIHPEAIVLEPEIIRALYKPRKLFSHKGNYGHAAIIAGSFGMMGAVTLATLSCLRAGAGKVTAHIPHCGYSILQTAVPEAMALVEPGEHYLEGISSLEKYDALGIGPGLGQAATHPTLLQRIFIAFKKPMVLDADALNAIARHLDLLLLIHPFSILTPHPAEFDRIFGKQENDFARMRMARIKAKELQVIMVLKGHRTFIAMPGGNAFYNSTGNPGMATAGSGDVLTGMLTSLLAQGYPPDQAALLGVYLHGFAGDAAAMARSQEALVASDIIENFSAAFKWLGKI